MHTQFYASKEGGDSLFYECVCKVRPPVWFTEVCWVLLSSKEAVK